MWIYLLIGLIFLILALESYFKGGINALVTLMGVIVAVNLSGWFGSMAFQWMGDKWWPIDTHPFWNRAVPVVAGFITLVVLFSILGTVASIMLRKRLEAQWEEYRLENYKGMNRKFGLCVGLITASVYSVMALTLIYQLGNFTVPFKNDNDPWALKTLNEAREQLDNTPFIKLAAAYDNTPDLHYEVRDTLVLFLNNNAKTIEKHIHVYPGFYALAETDEIKSLLGIGEEEEEEDDSSVYEPDSGGGYSSDEPLYAMWKKQAGNLSLPKLLGNSDVVSTVNTRYEELKAIEPNSDEEKKLLAFMRDIRVFFDTGESELYGRDAIVGRWKFAPNVSLRENKKTRTTISVDEMRGIQSTVGKMRRVTLQVWPEADRNQIRVNGLSVAGAYEQVLKKLREEYQKAIDDGEVDDDAYGYGPGYGGGFSQPVGFEETYGEQGGEANEGQAKVEEARRMLAWIRAKNPVWIPRELGRSMSRGDTMRIGSGSWEGSGILFRVTVKPAKVDLSKEAEILSGAMRAAWPLRSGKLKATIVKGRLHVQSGRDVFVFTRY